MLLSFHYCRLDVKNFTAANHIDPLTTENKSLDA